MKTMTCSEVEFKLVSGLYILHQSGKGMRSGVRGKEMPLQTFTCWESYQEKNNYMLGLASEKWQSLAPKPIKFSVPGWFP